MVLQQLIIGKNQVPSPVRRYRAFLHDFLSPQTPNSYSNNFSFFSVECPFDRLQEFFQNINYMVHFTFFKKWKKNLDMLQLP